MSENSGREKGKRVFAGRVNRELEVVVKMKRG